MEKILERTVDIKEFFDKDPRHLITLIGKKIIVTAINNEVHEGKLYLIDPASSTIIIMKQSDGKCDAALLKCHAITEIQVYDAHDEDNPLYKICEVVPEFKDEKRRVAVKEWLLKHLIYVEEEGVNLKILNDLLIVPPYGKEQCYSANTIILGRIVNILSKMPDID